ncbi:response regulator [Lichenicola sp.]|uniref:response regulator n=1 Tax=Lichenicola sp. TaxID=2804529 RepID=UPI003AFF746B
MCDLLLLDDDPLVRTALLEALRDEGLDVIVAGDETEALAALRRPVPPKVFVTDLDLGTRRNGFVIAGIAQIVFPGLAIIYITGRPDAVQGHVMGPGEMLMLKPFRPSELVAAAREMIARQDVAARPVE